MPVVLLVLSTGSLFSQAIICATGATPPVVRAEGLTERVGDIQLTCTGTPGNTLTANVTVSLNTSITNRISSSPPPSGGAALTGIVFTADSGMGPQPVVIPPLFAGPNLLAYNGVALTFSAQGTLNLNVSGIRANANLLPVGLPIIASVSINNAGLALTSAQLTTGTSRRGLYVSYTASLICAQTGSPIPDALTFASLITAGTAFETARVTEGFGDALQPLSGFQNFHADSGERILLRYTGFPGDANVYVPDVVAGTDALQPTSTGDFGLKVSGGVYAPSLEGTLLLARVSGANASGAGGSPVYQPGAIGSGSVALGTVTQLTVAADGSFYVVYEVVDANPSNIESATIPTFLGLAPDPNRQASLTTEQVYLAPSSTVGLATTGDPVPRFVPETAQPDCAIVGDCDPIPPKLTVTPASLSFTLQAGTTEQTANVTIANSGGGGLSWQASMAYTSGAGWLSLSPSKGFGNSTLGTIAIPHSLAPGTYTGTLTVDGGPIAGFAAIPVTLNLTAPPAPPVPSIGSVVSAASFLPEPVVPGSLVTIMGSLFNGSKVSATFNNLAGTVVFSNATQINVLVPASLTGQTAANLVVTVDGASSVPIPVMVAPFEPGIFSGGIVNEDGSVNSASHPAATGSVIAMWGTGLSGSGTITANIGGQNIATPYYAGPAPGIPGVQQVNLIVPAGLTTGTTQVYVCGTVSGSPVCSVPSPLTIK